MNDICEHCGTKAAAGMMKRWHGDNCKKKPVTDNHVVEEIIEETKGEEKMSMFVEVTSVEKQCPVIINIEHVIEIVPWKTGGCALFIADGSVPGGRSQYRVTESYDLFKQFALQTVSADDIQKKIAKLKGG
jgi:hypothetical protein